MNPLLAFGLPSGGEWFIILLIALIVFGPKKLPELARGLGRSLGEFKKAKAEFEREMHAAAEPSRDPAPGATTTTPSAPALLPPVYEQAHANAAAAETEPTPAPVVTPTPAANTIPQTKIV